MSSSWLVSADIEIEKRDACYPNNGSQWPIQYRSTYNTLTTSVAQYHGSACNGLQTAANTLRQHGWTRTSDCVSHVRTVVQNNPCLGVVPVALVAVTLTWEAIKSIRAWWTGEISGKRCVKNLLDDLAAIAGGAAGGAGGSAYGGLIGSIFGPAGTFVGIGIGGLVGGVFGSIVAAELSKRLTEKLFDVPQSVAVENAYRYFGLTQYCSNGEVNSAYHRLALEKHPDKEGGSKEKFLELQINLAIIKRHRDDL